MHAYFSFIFLNLALFPLWWPSRLEGEILSLVSPETSWTLFSVSWSLAFPTPALNASRMGFCACFTVLTAHSDRWSFGPHLPKCLPSPPLNDKRKPIPALWLGVWSALPHPLPPTKSYSSLSTQLSAHCSQADFSDATLVLVPLSGLPQPLCFHLPWQKTLGNAVWPPGMGYKRLNSCPSFSCDFGQAP